MRIWKKGVAGKKSDWAFMTKFVVPHFDIDEDYLVRYRVIQTPWFGLYLHRLGTPDSRATLHDHPWSFVSLVLRGGYTEVRRNNRTMGDYLHKVRRLNMMRRDDAHYILKLKREPTWTLLLVGKRRRTWGYWEKQEGQVVWDHGNRTSVEEWVWIEFDKHPYAGQFDAAVRARRVRGE